MKNKEILPQRKFFCRLLNKVMKDPVTTPYGHNYDRKTLLNWMRKHGQKCPLSGEPLRPSDIQTNALLQWEILYWKRKNGDALDVSRHSAEFTLPQDRKLDVPPSMPCPSSEFTLQDKTDSPPSVPRRKSSDIDLPSMCQLEKKNAKGKTTTTSTADYARTLLFSDVFRSLTSNDGDLSVEEGTNSIEPENILSVLDQVESTLDIVC
jgi:hypothetical protein